MKWHRKWIFSLVFALAMAPVAIAEDIDLFASGLASGAAAAAIPNVIFVLDNTSNWSRESQKWPDGTQGQSEVEAILNTLGALRAQDKDLNVAIVEFTTLGTANEDGGYVRFDLQSMQENWGELSGLLNEINAGINDPDEKRNSNSSYGNLASDLYAFLAGEEQSFSGSGTPPELADESGYFTPYSVFRSPLTESDICSETYVVFISNPDSNGPEVDAAANSTRLRALYSDMGETLTSGLAGEDTEGMSMREFEEIKGNSGSSNTDVLGFSQQCFQNSNACDAAINGNALELSAGTSISEECPANGDCFCSQVSQSSSACSGGQKQFEVVKPASDERESYGPTSALVDGADFNFDDWTKFLHQYGVPLTIPGEDGAPDSIVRIPVTTYTVDVFNEQPSEVHSSLMDSAAEVGGGYRQEATNAAELEQALGRIFGDIIDINTSFAAVTLPLSATNRAQAENKVFVGMFRPATQRKPRWLGNLKQYQLAVFDGRVELADVSLNRAINPQTGFAQSCATSFWTTDTSDEPKNADGAKGPYFEGLGMEPSPTSECLAEFRGSRSVLSDDPDGPFVEKGGVAQQIRGQAERLILTQTGNGALRDVTAADIGGDDKVFDFLVGSDAGLRGGDLYVPDADGNYVDNLRLVDAEVMPFEGRRPTIHGDIVHSRPLTITYGSNGNGTSTFRVFYGANDGLYRAVDPLYGTEDWAFVAPEHWDGISRLYANTPTVDFYGLDASQSDDIGAQPKRYFFDGATGAFTRYNSDDQLIEGYIYLTMRRGGRMVYALDVSPDTGSAGNPPSQPSFLWKAGCSDDTGASCTDVELSGIGQTWSTPVTGFVKGYVGDGESAEAPNPVLLMGGGWDECLDEDSASLSVGSCATGNFVYALDGKTGRLLRKFETQAPVVAEIETLDIDYDGYIDFAYAADAAGNLYRVTFSQITDGVIDPSITLGPSEWVWPVEPIAYSNRTGVRFMNQPISAEVGNTVFIAIGSGDRERPLKQNYPYAEDVENRFYVFVDQPFAAESRSIDLDSMLNAADGLSSEPDENGAIETLLDTNGWYLDLPDQGEQIVNQAAIGSGYVFFNSFQAEGSTEGFCSDLGTAKAYRVPLFAPEAVEGKEFGEGVPIPPIIVTVKLDNGQAVCSEDCGPGEITEDVVTLIIGLEGFEVVDITPQPPSKVREAFRVENLDRL